MKKLLVIASMLLLICGAAQTASIQQVVDAQSGGERWTTVVY